MYYISNIDAANFDFRQNMAITHLGSVKFLYSYSDWQLDYLLPIQGGRFRRASLRVLNRHRGARWKGAKRELSGCFPALHAKTVGFLYTIDAQAVQTALDAAIH
jgi:hypothetical protein